MRNETRQSIMIDPSTKKHRPFRFKRHDLVTHVDFSGDVFMIIEIYVGDQLEYDCLNLSSHKDPLRRFQYEFLAPWEGQITIKQTL